MLIDIVNKNAERALLSAVEQSDQRHALRGALYFRCAKLNQKPQEEEILLIFRSLLQDKKAAIYFFHDGDLAIAWNGGKKSVLDDVCKQLYAYFHLTGNEALHTYYDFNAHGEDLRLALRDKLKSFPANSKKPHAHSADHPMKPAFTDAQLRHIKKHAAERRTLKVPTILIVEDQDFSRSLLKGMLNKIYECYCAATAEQAVALYAEHIPCITFLDIELPDANGHDVAALIKRHDPESFVVMVTANHYEKDVALARTNKVQGFIVKPYSKQKIMEAVRKFRGART